MTREEAQNWLHKLYTRADITDEYGDMEDMQPYEEAINMAISALKDIEKIQFIVDTYFTRGSKSGYECMGEIDRILEPYQKGGE